MNQLMLESCVHPWYLNNVYKDKCKSVRVQCIGTIRLATSFDHVGLSSGLYYEPVNVRKLRTSLVS
jgi:hypothetical protein